MDIKDDVSNDADVEVIAYACGPANQRRYVEPGNAFLGWHVDEATALVDRAHVTRLTAENARLQAEVKQLKSWQETVRENSLLLIQLDALQSELTKARELLHKYFVKPDKCAFAARDIGEFLLEKKPCDTCNGTMVVDDGEINSSGGVDFENGPVQCIKDCPDCLPASKNLTNQSPIQCDGCQAGIPIEVNQYGTPLHRMGCEGGYPNYMACTAKLYTEELVAWTSVNSLGFLDKRRNEKRTAWRLNLSTHPLESEDIALYRHPQRPVVLPRTL